MKTPQVERRYTRRGLIRGLAATVLLACWTKGLRPWYGPHYLVDAQVRRMAVWAG